MTLSLRDILLKAHPENQDCLFFPEEDKVFNMPSLLAQLNKFQQLLCKRGVGHGDIVSVISSNTCAMVIAQLACLDYGATVMPVNPSLTPEEIDELLAHASPKLLISDIYQPKKKGLIVEPLTAYEGYEPTPIAKDRIGGNILIYTSGTTGNPKGVFLTLEQLLYNLKETQQRFGMAEERVTACFLPLFHLFGIMSDLLMTLIYGGKVVVTPAFDMTVVPKIVAAINAHQVNSFSAVPLMFDLLVKLNAKIPEGQLKYCISGGGPLREEVRLAFDEKFKARIVPAYGVTECSCFCLCSDPEDIVPLSSGKPVAMEVLIVDRFGREVPVGELGELVIKGPTVIADGYFRDDRECYMEIDGDNWFRTGDLVRKDEQGHFYITGRLKNMVIKGGAKVYLEDVDGFVQKIPGIKDVVSMKLNPELTLEIEEFVSFVVLDQAHHPLLSEQDIKAKIKAGIGHQKVPNQIVFLKQIDRSPTGKMKIRELSQITS